MKSNLARTTQLVLFVTALCMTMASAAQAQGPACSLALAAGKYATSGSGIIGAVPVGVPVAAVTLVTVDAEGNFTGKETASLDGAIKRVTFIDGKITLDADCTGTASWSESISGTTVGFATMDLVFDDDMRELRFVFTSFKIPDGTEVAITLKGEGRKLFPRSSNQQ